MRANFALTKGQHSKYQLPKYITAFNLPLSVRTSQVDDEASGFMKPILKLI